MAPEKHDLAATRERLEFLLDGDGGDHRRTAASSANEGSTRQAFIAGAAFSGLIAGSIFLTNFIDAKLHDSTPTTSKVADATSVTPGVVQNEALSSAGTDGTKMRRVSMTTPLSTFSNPLSNPSLTTLVPPAVSTPPALTRIPNPVSALNPPADQALVPVAGLSTSRSVITGIADPTTMTASYYWTFTLRNQTSSSKEAQMNISLPQGAVVSRATLWINGRAEEAAFNTTSQVQNAYDWIVSRNRDPLLITQKEDGNINLKASPVMPNKEMKIRIGITTPMQMTADGQSQMELPHIIDANLNFYCQQNIHITSDAPLVSNDARMSSPTQKKGFLLRGNLNAGDLKKLQVVAQRDPDMVRFATRATHSNPPSYIVAELQKDNQGLSTLNLTKSITKPDCQILKDEHAAFRLSYLWVKKEIERLVKTNDSGQAEQLATVYRVVSPISGAVVLERQSDYDYNGLDRNMYKSLAYEPRQGDDEGRAGGGGGNSFADAEASQAVPMAESKLQRQSPTPTAAPQMALAPSAPAPKSSFDTVRGAAGMNYDATPAAAKPMLSSRRKAERNSESAGKFTNKMASQSIPADMAKARNVQTKTKLADKSAVQKSGFTNANANAVAGSASETNQLVPSELQAAQPLSVKANDKAMRLAGLNGTNVESMSEDANVWFLSGAVSTVALVTLLGLTFAGGFVLYAMAAMRLYRRQKGALKLAGCGALWITVAAFSPLFSQVFSTLLAIGLLTAAGTKALKSHS